MTTTAHVLDDRLDRNARVASVTEMAIAGLDMHDRDLRLAVEAFRKEQAQAIGSPGEAPIIGRMESPETLALVAEWHCASIQLQAAHRKATLAARRAELAMERVKQAVRDFEAVDPEGAWALDCHRLAIVDALGPKRTIFAFAKSLVMAAADADVRTDDLPPAIQKQIEDSPEMGAFLSDFIDVLSSGGSGVREHLRAIVSSTNAAHRAKGDEDLPKPVRFLAYLAAELAGEGK